MASKLVTYGAVLLVCLAALAIARSTVVGSGSPPRTISRMIQCAFIPDGYFYVKGSAPEGFEDFDHIELLVSAAGGRRPPADSRVYARDGKVYKFTKFAEFNTHSSGRGIVFEFETEAIEGVSYKFRGRFISICVFAEDETDPKSVVAEGRMAKFKDDGEEATAQVQYTYSKSERPRS